MFIEIGRVSLKELGVDIAPRVEPRPRLNPLTGLAVVALGTGSPVQGAVTRALKDEGAVVILKTSVGEVVQMLSAFIPSVIVAEVGPGTEGGATLVEAIRALPPDYGGRLPIIGVSGAPVDPAPTLQAGFQGMLVGPFEGADVARTILRAIDRPA